MKISESVKNAIKRLVTNNENVDVENTDYVYGYILFYAKASTLTPTVRVSEKESGLFIETLVAPEFDEDGNFTVQYKNIERFANKFFSEVEFIDAVNNQ